MDAKSSLLTNRTGAAIRIKNGTDTRSDYRLSKIAEERCLERVKTVSDRDNCVIFEVDRTQERPLVERILKSGYPTPEKEGNLRLVSKSNSHVLSIPYSSTYYSRSASRQSIVKPLMNFRTGSRRRSSNGVTPSNDKDYLVSLQPSYPESGDMRRRRDLKHYIESASIGNDYIQKLNNELDFIENSTDKTPRSVDAIKNDPFVGLKKNKKSAKTAIIAHNMDYKFMDDNSSIVDNTCESWQRIICVRHGERVDFTFGPHWVEKAFDRKTGQYRRINLNMPCILPKKDNPWRDYIGDSPLTEIGMMQALLTGEALREKSAFVNVCYSSPSLRCVQTAHYILKGMGVEKSVQIRVEPGLFEFLGWYERGRPKFIDPKDMKSFGYNVDPSYVPKLTVDRLSEDEKYLDYYNRSYKVTYFISESHKKEGGSLLLSGHAGTLESCTRQMLGLKPRSYQDFNQAIRKVSFLGLNMIERRRCSNSDFRSTPAYTKWSFKEPPIPPIQHCQNAAYDWRTIMGN